MRLTTILLATLCSFQVFGQPKIIPEPVSMQLNNGALPLGKNIVWTTTVNSTALSQAKTQVEADFRKMVAAGGETRISLTLLKKEDAGIGTEGYLLDIDKEGMHIAANQENGLFYGLQTVRQLLSAPEAPYLTIRDYPVVGYRGMMLDVARHFFTKAEVMQYIDEIAAYKFNMLHLHLTDDGGWRIEIKSYPKLTAVGAWGVEKYGYYGEYSPAGKNAKYNYGGFYTQQDIKDIVKYAKEKFIDILPEIDIPGHSMAAVVAYPELSGTKDAVNYKVYSGEKGFMDWTDHGIVARYDNTLNPAKPEVYRFLDKVFEEVAGLFPYEYIHVGGDECAKNYWQKDPNVTALMQKEKLKNYEEVQAYFEKKVEKIVTAKGKKLVGWDEILEGGVAPGATIMSWRGEKGGIEAARLQHKVIMTPNNYVYLDFMQGNKFVESKVYETLRLKKVYTFSPVPAGVDPKFILGGQANLWTEQVFDFRKVEYMTWPRALAVAECLWTPAAKKDWPRFVEKVEQHMQAFDKDTISYAPSIYEPDVTAQYTKDSVWLCTFTPEIDGLDMHYSVDNSFPDIKSLAYQKPFALPEDAVMIRIVSYKNGRQVGRILTIPVAALKKD
ncbi:family 20 glycosylhydrolase [Chitinophaga sp.]|uniref:beta-N-acetylhexosaminidase n=1 Tax=Chitinophaga sp. TaxID=1869181 RepID=UPI0031D0834E